MRGKLNSLKRSFLSAGIIVLSLFVIAAVNSACQKPVAEEQAETAETDKITMIEEGLNTLEGTVKFVHGSFLYVPEIVGFDVVLPSGVDGSGLEGQAVRLEGEFKRENPSILMANRIDIREGEGSYRSFFVESGEEQAPPFFNQHDRESYPVLKLTTTAASEAWEGKERGRVFGKLETQTAAEAGGQKEMFAISISDDKGKPVGKILVDTISDYAAYSKKKLRLFDSFWFYLNIKNTVEAKTRARTKDLFHADVVFTGLY